MRQETTRTRAIRRAQHDGYAPFIVRPAVRRDAFRRLNIPVTAVFWFAVAVLVGEIVRWALK